MAENEKKKPGRPRSEKAREAILTAAAELLEEAGVGRLTVEAVASRAGVGKPTIYRHWANAQDLAMAAMMAQPPAARSRRRKASIAPDGSALAELEAHLRGIIGTFATPRGRQAALMLASADADSEIFKGFRNQVVLKGRDEGRAILARAIGNGEVADGLPVETVLDLVYGPIFFRLLTRYAPLDDAFADELVTLLMRKVVR